MPADRVEFLHNPILISIYKKYRDEQNEWFNWKQNSTIIHSFKLSIVKIITRPSNPQTPSLYNQISIRKTLVLDYYLQLHYTIALSQCLTN